MLQCNMTAASAPLLAIIRPSITRRQRRLLFVDDSHKGTLTRHRAKAGLDMVLGRGNRATISASLQSSLSVNKSVLPKSRKGVPVDEGVRDAGGSEAGR